MLTEPALDLSAAVTPCWLFGIGLKYSVPRTTVPAATSEGSVLALCYCWLLCTHQACLRQNFWTISYQKVPEWSFLDSIRRQLKPNTCLELHRLSAATETTVELDIDV